MKYTKRHYKDIAEIICETRTNPERRLDWSNEALEAINYLENQFIALFADDNPRFSEKRFRKVSSA